MRERRGGVDRAQSPVGARARHEVDHQLTLEPRQVLDVVRGAGHVTAGGVVRRLLARGRRRPADRVAWSGGGRSRCHPAAGAVPDRYPAGRGSRTNGSNGAGAGPVTSWKNFTRTFSREPPTIGLAPAHVGQRRDLAGGDLAGVAHGLGGERPAGEERFGARQANHGRTDPAVRAGARWQWCRPSAASGPRR